MWAIPKSNAGNPANHSEIHQISHRPLQVVDGRYRAISAANRYPDATLNTLRRELSHAFRQRSTSRSESWRSSARDDVIARGLMNAFLCRSPFDWQCAGLRCGTPTRVRARVDPSLPPRRPAVGSCRRPGASIKALDAVPAGRAPHGSLKARSDVRGNPKKVWPFVTIRGSRTTRSQWVQRS